MIIRIAASVWYFCYNARISIIDRKDWKRKDDARKKKLLIQVKVWSPMNINLCENEAKGPDF